ncbi:MAG: hypothetical protein JSS02_33325 [Planctomycetes bacterium]|nr:hypothetical protein [Planctomycetota bacterium]
MNCDIARQTLEFPGSDHVPAVSTREAEVHVQGCAECQQAVGRQRHLDQRISQVCQDVPIPLGLKERLLARLANAEAAATGPAPLPAATGVANLPSPSLAGERHATRRMWLVERWRSLTAVCLAGLAVGLWWWTKTTLPQMTLDTAIQAALAAPPEQMGAFERFRSGVALTLPTTMVTDALTEPPGQLPDVEIAVYRFRIRDTSGRWVNGRLLAIPRVALSDPPQATRFLTGPAQASRLPYRTTAWAEGPLVYVCYVEGTEETLFKLKPQTA